MQRFFALTKGSIIVFLRKYIEQIQSFTSSFSEIDECFIFNVTCGSGAECVNTDGSYQCQCSTGFKEELDGNCSGKIYRPRLNLPTDFLVCRAVRRTEKDSPVLCDSAVWWNCVWAPRKCRNGEVTEVNRVTTKCLTYGCSFCSALMIEQATLELTCL